MAKKNLKRLVDSGVKFGFGTDSGPPARFPGYFEHMEMELMVQAGLTPMQVIQAATKNAAEFLGQSSNLGTLEVGRWADLPYSAATRWPTSATHERSSRCT